VYPSFALILEQKAAAKIKEMAPSKQGEQRKRCESQHTLFFQERHKSDPHGKAFSLGDRYLCHNYTEMKRAESREKRGNIRLFLLIGNYAV
jgi:hypothetical protein